MHATADRPLAVRPDARTVPTSRAGRRLLWIAAVLVVPVPAYVLTVALVPAARLLQLAGALTVLAVAESGRGTLPLLLALLAGQGLLWSALLWGVVSALRRRPALVGAVLAGLAAGALLWPIYHTPFHGTRARTTLGQVYR